MALSKDQNETLEQFLELVNELEASSLYRELLQHNKITLRFTAKGNQPASQEIVNLNEEHLKAFLLTARLLAQNNERCSIQNLSGIFESLGDDPWWPKFNGIRWKLNEFLDTPYPFSIDGQQVTSRHLFDVFLYGHYAHRTREKEEAYRKWRANAPLFQFYKQGFLAALSTLFHCAHEMKLIASEVLGSEHPKP